MFNLLPENLRKEIISEYRLRLIIVVVVFVIITQISFLVFLFPSWLTSFYKERDFLAMGDEVNKSLLSLDISSTTSYINSLNLTLNIIDESLEYPKLVPIINEVLSKKTSGIKIGAIYYSVDSKNTATLNINGISDKRETLVSFTESLKNVEYMKKVDLPLSNLAKDRNIDFSININIEK